MTVGKLIELLKQYPEEMHVLVDGYESGYDEVSKPRMIKKKKGSSEWYNGKYEEVTNYKRANDAVVISRKERPV
jgi:hypothetical protein